MKNLKKASEMFSNYFLKKEHTIPWVLLLGDKGVGKTTLLYYLLSSNRDKVFPETSFNFIDISYGTEWFKLIDLGNEIIEDKNYLNFFLNIANGIVYVINGESDESLQEATISFHKIIEFIPYNIPILILINKRHPERNINLSDVLNYFDLIKISSPSQPRSFHFEICTILYGDGIYRAFDWFVSKLIFYEGYYQSVTVHRALIYDVNGLLDFDVYFSDLISDTQDAVLITGLLSALNSMTKTLFNESSFLDVVTVGDFSLVLVSRKQKICCLFVEKGGALGKAKQIAEMILDIFLEEGENGRMAIFNLVEENKYKDDGMTTYQKVNYE